jgi:NADPH:quinone reductase-like Zn-dependent oxidoreductase
MTAAIFTRYPRDLAIIGDLMAAGTVRAVIDRRYALRDATVAIRYLEGGHARGKVVIEAAAGVGRAGA